MTLPISDLLHRLALGHIHTLPLGTAGGNAQHHRSRRPEPGDFVLVDGTLGTPPERCMGVLVGLSPPLPPPDEKDVHEYSRTWAIDCLDGVRRDWSNVRVIALPVGNPFGELNERFRLPLAEGCRAKVR